MEYIHYGSSSFDPDRFVEIRNEIFVKPTGGLWASSTEAKYGWKEWCSDNGDFKECKNDNSFKFKLKEGAKVFHIYSEEDLKQLPRNNEASWMTIGNTYFLDFEKILASGIDAIEYHLSEEKKPENWDNGLYYLLYGWDCDSILIMNKEIVEVIE